MLKYRAIKIMLAVITALFVYFGEIASTFPFKRNIEEPSAVEKIQPFTYKLTNALSTNAETYKIDSVFKDLLVENNIKGMSVAVTRRGKLVYAKGFGFADKELNVAVQPWHLFRIASVSKLITAVGIMKLTEDGKLDLNDKVFGKNGILNDSIFLHYKDKRVEDITVQELLKHTAGWKHKGNDPVFRIMEIAKKSHIDPKDMGIDDIIKYVLDQKLNFNPGEKYSYSNFGYCVLGKIIEKVSGMRYQDYITSSILQPLGIYDMHLGKSFIEDQLPHEVIYYNNDDSIPVPAFNGDNVMVSPSYGGNSMELLGAAGGWVASAPELVKFVCAIDGFSSRPDILSIPSIIKMTNAGVKDKHLLGWRGTDGYGTWWRTGTLSGTVALVMRYDNEFNWVVLLNTTPKNKRKIHNEISRTIFTAMENTRNWPQRNLFYVQ